MCHSFSLAFLEGQLGAKNAVAIGCPRRLECAPAHIYSKSHVLVWESGAD